MSPLVETIEVSEDLLKDDGATDKTSDISQTPSEWRTGKVLLY